MSDPSVIAAAIVTVIAATAGAIVTVVNAVAAAKDRRASRQDRAVLTETTASTDRKADTLIEKATEIHTVTNGNLSKVQGQLEVANAQIAGLHRKVQSLESAIATMAAAQGHRRRTDSEPS